MFDLALGITRWCIEHHDIVLWLIGLYGVSVVWNAWFARAVENYEVHRSQQSQDERSV